MEQLSHQVLEKLLILYSCEFFMQYNINNKQVEVTIYRLLLISYHNQNFNVS